MRSGVIKANYSKKKSHDSSCISDRRKKVALYRAAKQCVCLLFFSFVIIHLFLYSVQLRAALDKDIQTQNQHLWDKFVHCDQQQKQQKQQKQQEQQKPWTGASSVGGDGDTKILINTLQRTVDEQNYELYQKQDELDSLKKYIKEQQEVHELEMGMLRAKIDDGAKEVKEVKEMNRGSLVSKEENSRLDQEHKQTEHENENTKYDPSKIMYLNVSDSTILRDHNPPVGRGETETSTKYSIDILSIASIHSIKRAEIQMKTWGSHVSRRHFWLATEFDDPDPSCHTSMTAEDMTELCHTCRKLGMKFWQSRNASNDVTYNFHNLFAQEPWLKQKANPTGWLCAQKRFVSAFSKLMAIYREGRDKYGIDLPDYLVFGDDDTYVNLEMFEEELLRAPAEEVKQKNLTLQDELSMVYPTQNTPVVWAGCRIRRPISVLQDTIPYGGFGVMFSKAAIERMIQPLYCNNTSTGFEWEACEHFTPAYQNLSSIGELEYFNPGMSVSDLMGSYTEKISPFCLHSGTLAIKLLPSLPFQDAFVFNFFRFSFSLLFGEDWAIGYFVNYFNISRHVVPTGHLHPNKAWNDKIYWYNDQMADIKHARLHAWHDGSEMYKRDEGNCKNKGRRCNETSGVCHPMSEDRMRRVHGKVKALFPKKYRTLQ